MKSVSAEQPAKSGERIENGDKDTKKKKRRGGRRSKNTSGIIDFVIVARIDLDWFYRRFPLG